MTRPKTQSDEQVLEAAYRLMASLPGIGTWTAAQVGHRALGDADALPTRRGGNACRSRT